MSDDFDALMDAVQTLIQLKPGDVLTEQMIADLHLVDAHNREDGERAVDAFHRGYEMGVRRGSNADTAKLVEERDSARLEAMTAKALRDMMRDGEAIAALVAHNDALRSAYQVAKRGGGATNWATLTDRLGAVLTQYHDITNKARELASADTHPKGGNSTQIEVPSPMSGAVPEGQTPIGCGQ